MDLMEAIEQRSSRRSYLDTPIHPESIAHFKQLLCSFNQESHLSLQWIEDGARSFEGFGKSYGMFTNVRSFFAMVGKEKDIHLKEKIGYYGEQLVLEATKLGLGTCWVGGAFDKKNCPCQKDEDERLICVITVGNVEKERGLKEKTLYKVVHRGGKSITAMIGTDESILPDWFYRGMKAVQKAPSAANRQPVRFTYKDNTVSAKVGKTDAFQLVDLGIAKCHFEIAAGGKFLLGNGNFWQKPDTVDEAILPLQE